MSSHEQLFQDCNRNPRDPRRTCHFRIRRHKRIRKIRHPTSAPINIISADTDGDGITNAQEMIAAGTNPNLADTDGDGNKRLRMKYTSTAPIQPSLTLNGDLISDSDEIRLGTNPLTFDGQMKNPPTGSTSTMKVSRTTPIIPLVHSQIQDGAQRRPTAVISRSKYDPAAAIRRNPSS